MKFTETKRADFIKATEKLSGVWLAPNGSEWSTEKTETCVFFFNWCLDYFPPDTARTFSEREVERFQPEYIYEFSLTSEIKDEKFNEHIKQLIKEALKEWEEKGLNPSIQAFLVVYDSRYYRVQLEYAETSKWKVEATGKRIKEDRWDD